MRLFSKITTEKDTFPALTGMRAIAAFMVFFHHCGLQLKPDVIIGLQLSFYIGVSFFFVLSGFLITYNYYDNVTITKPWLKAYFVKRFVRIYPVYFLILTWVVLTHDRHGIMFLLQNYTLTHKLQFLFKSYGIAIAPSWSLTAEMCFYILAPFIFVFCKRYQPIYAYLFLLGVFVVLLLNMPSSKDGLLNLFFYTFFGRVSEFFAGISLALLVKRQHRLLLALKGKWTILGLTGIAILLIPLIYITNKPDSIRNPVMVSINNYLLPLPIVMLYIGLIYEKTLLQRILKNKWFLLFGRSSYALYLLHLNMLIHTYRLLDVKGKPPYYYNIYCILTFLLCLALSIIIYLYYEEPANRFIRKQFKAKTQTIANAIQTNN